MYLPTMPTGRRIYEEVWAMAQVLLKKPSKFQDKLWWQKDNWEEILE
jgi:hypothetical protein